ncbi:MAG TPA: hypothetical protein VEX69_03230 [Candidatus Limnocylindria bacterium]|nr:hypothetical protein [Candidatus Limnocylindria bacterium]
MPRPLLIFVLAATLFTSGAQSARAHSQPHSQLVPATVGGAAQTIDGVAARIEDDILTESELRELAAFQQLVDGRSKTRAELIRELAAQWIVRGDANTAKFPRPSQADVDRAYSELMKQFKSPEEFQARCAAAGITEAGVRRMLEEQLYLSRFIDFRFRPAAQISDEEIEKYYRDEFAPQLKARGEPVPPVEDVSDTIREVLIQRAISERASKWLDETRDHLKIDLVTQGGGS